MKVTNLTSIAIALQPVVAGLGVLIVNQESNYSLVASQQPPLINEQANFRPIGSSTGFINK